jgi:GDPmannose 4,6-dehydratase
VVDTGVGATVRDFCEASFSAVGLDYKDFVQTENRYLRPTEVDALIADPAKMKQKLNWSAATKWQELAKIMVEADLEKLS